MVNNYAKSLIVIISLFTLIGCSSVPTHTNLAPELNLKKRTNTFTNALPWHISSQDARIERHLIEIVDGDNVAQLINEQQSLRQLIQNSLTQAWLDKNLTIDQNSDRKIDIKLVKALTSVTQHTVSYDVSSQMIIKIVLTYQGKSYVKLFRSNEHWDAAFSKSIPNITEKLNTQLSQLLEMIIEDQELNAQLQSF